MTIAGYVCQICGSIYERIEKARTFSPGCPRCGSAKVMRSKEPLDRPRKVEPRPVRASDISRPQGRDQPR